MLESFVLREEDSVRVQQEDLRAVTTAVFTKMGVPFDDAALAADVLLLADIRGVDSHGVSNMLRSYMQGYQAGRIKPVPEWRVVRERPSTANIDADEGLGIIIAPKAMDGAPFVRPFDRLRANGVGQARDNKTGGTSCWRALS